MKPIVRVEERLKYASLVIMYILMCIFFIVQWNLIVSIHLFHQQSLVRIHLI